MQFNNTFANNSGDHLKLKKAKQIYTLDSRKDKINNYKVVKQKVRSFDHKINYNKGLIFDNFRDNCFAGPTYSGTMSASTTGGILQLGSGFNNTFQNYYKNKLITITGGTGAGQIRLITSSNTNGFITVEKAFNPVLDNTSVYIIKHAVTLPYTRVSVDVGLGTTDDGQLTF